MGPHIAWAKSSDARGHPWMTPASHATGSGHPGTNILGGSPAYNAATSAAASASTGTVERRKRREMELNALTRSMLNTHMPAAAIA